MDKMEYAEVDGKKELKAEDADLPIFACALKGEPAAKVAYQLLMLRAKKEHFGEGQIVDLEESRRYQRIVDEMRQFHENTSHRGYSLLEIITSNQLNPRRLEDASQQDIRAAYHREDAEFIAELA